MTSRTQPPNPTPFLTERERFIANQLKKLRDLQAQGHIVGGGPQKFGSAVTGRTEVKDSHDR